MVASTLGVADAHPHPDERGEGGENAATEELHPWALEMYRGGMSFNGNERSKLFLNQGGGRFVDHSDLCGADSPLDGRGLVACDFDDDGDLDLFVHNLQRERHNLFRNELRSAQEADAGRGGTTGFIKVRVRGTRANIDGVGASVTLVNGRGEWTQLVSRGSGFASCQPPELVFGLGDRPGGELRVRWPGPQGELESFGRVNAGSRVLLVEGEGAPQPRAGAAFSLADPLAAGLKIGPGEPVPRLELVDAAGQPVLIEPAVAAEGGELYLAFWASYCAPCVREMPALVALDGQPGKKVVAISVDVPLERPRAEALLEAAEAPFQALYLSMEEDANEGGVDELADLLRLPIPTLLVIDAEGRLVKVLRGPEEGGD